MENLIDEIHGLVWGIPALLMIVGVGIYLSVRLRFVQITLFPSAWKHFVRQLRPSMSTESRSSFQALCTALAATVGTGNLVGVAGAICLGGPGAVFWMWLCGILGMVTKYTEALLSIRFRVKTENGFSGGPMYMIQMGLPPQYHFLAWIYAVFGMIAAFGVGNATQINAAMTALRVCCQAYDWVLSPGMQLMITSAFASVIAFLLLGGAKSLARAAERLIPFAAAGYILLCLGVLFVRWREIPVAFAAIFQGAFSPGGVTGGMIGSSFLALRVGCSRGVFTNEAGMGTASIAHASAEGVHPAAQGLMGIMEVFLDTVVICTLTALVILVSGLPIPYGTDIGGQLTTAAFSQIYGNAAALCLAAALTLFALAAVLGWGLYGGRCSEFLFGRRAWRYFALLQIPTVFAGAFLESAAIWQISETVNGMMAIPNLITLAVLAPEAARLTKEYKNPVSDTGGGNYADFN